MSGSVRKWGLIALAVLLVLIVGGMVGFRVGIGILKGKVVAALGPDSEITKIRVGWSSVEVEGLRIKGQRGWPAADEVRAERVAVVPSLRSVLSGQYRVHSITIVKPYLSALRTKDGKLLVVSSLLAGAAGEGQAGSPSAPAVAPSTVTNGRITLQDGVVELFDATVARLPLKIRGKQDQRELCRGRQHRQPPVLPQRGPYHAVGVLHGGDPGGQPRRGGQGCGHPGADRRGGAGQAAKGAGGVLQRLFGGSKKR